MIQSHELPNRMVEANEVRKYRVNVQEVEREDGVVYAYDEIEFPIGTPIEVCEMKVAKHESKVAKKKAEKYLNDTDWVVAKIGEASILGNDIEELKAKYKDVLDARAEARASVRSS